MNVPTSARSCRVYSHCSAMKSTSKVISQACGSGANQLWIAAKNSGKSQWWGPPQKWPSGFKNVYASPLALTWTLWYLLCRFATHKVLINDGVSSLSNHIQILNVVIFTGKRKTHTCEACGRTAKQLAASASQLSPAQNWECLSNNSWCLSYITLPSLLCAYAASLFIFFVLFGSLWCLCFTNE